MAREKGDRLSWSPSESWLLAVQREVILSSAAKRIWSGRRLGDMVSLVLEWLPHLPLSSDLRALPGLTLVRKLPPPAERTRECLDTQLYPGLLGDRV